VIGEQHLQGSYALSLGRNTEAATQRTTTKHSRFISARSDLTTAGTVVPGGLLTGLASAIFDIERITGLSNSSLTDRQLGLRPVREAGPFSLPLSSGRARLSLLLSITPSQQPSVNANASSWRR
jgi:hypothetical protein